MKIPHKVHNIRKNMTKKKAGRPRSVKDELNIELSEALTKISGFAAARCGYKVTAHSVAKALGKNDAWVRNRVHRNVTSVNSELETIIAEYNRQISAYLNADLDRVEELAIELQAISGGIADRVNSIKSGL